MGIVVDDRTSSGVRTVKNPYDQVVNNAIKSQTEIHFKENVPETHQSPIDSTSSIAETEGSPEPTAENTQGAKMDAEMMEDVEMSSSSILEEVGNMDSWSEALRDRVTTDKEGTTEGVKPGEVDIDPGASTILNLKDS